MTLNHADLIGDHSDAVTQNAHADVIGDHSDAVTQNAWFLCVLSAAISGEVSILIQTEAESWGRFPLPRICHWESRQQSAFARTKTSIRHAFVQVVHAVDFIL